MAEQQREFRAETYVQAAREHVHVAVKLDEEREFVLAHYVAGLSVECIFRAYKSRINPVLDERHDLRQLARSGRFLDRVSGEQQQRLAAALGEVVRRWDNAHRFRCEKALRKFLKDRRLFPRKGDVLEDSSRRITNAAIEIVSLGVQQWTV